MDKDAALGRVKGLLMVSADRLEQGDASGSAAALLMVQDTLTSGEIASSDIESVFTGSVDGDVDENVPEKSEDVKPVVEKASSITSMKDRALAAAGK